MFRGRRQSQSIETAQVEKLENTFKKYVFNDRR